MTDTNIEHVEPEKDRDGTVPLFAFLLFMFGLLVGGLQFDIVLGHGAPVLGTVALMAGFLLAKGLIAYLPEKRKFWVLAISGVAAYFVGMLILSVTVCGSAWPVSNSCMAALEAL